MKLAVTFDNGTIFQHFGRCQYFKMFIIEKGKIVSSEVIDTNGNGHEAIAYFLKDNGVDAVICGGMGTGMLNALTLNGITIYGGNSGNVDEAVDAFLKGKLLQQVASCDHHDHEGHNCH